MAAIFPGECQYPFFPVDLFVGTLLLLLVLLLLLLLLPLLFVILPPTPTEVVVATEMGVSVGAEE